MCWPVKKRRLYSLTSREGFLKRQCHEKSCKTETLGEVGPVPRMREIQIFKFYALALICYVYLKIAHTEVKQNSSWAPVQMLI